MKSSFVVLGMGRMGVRLAALLADAGHDVVLGSRDPSRSERIRAGLHRPAIDAGDYFAAARCEFVIPAMFIRDGMFSTLEPLREALNDRIVVDISNPFNADYSDFILPWDTSAAEELQKRFPRTLVVGAFKNVWWEVFDSPQFAGIVSDVYVVSDDAESKQRFLDAVAETPFRYLDAGRLSNARTIERMTLLSGELGQRYGFFPRMHYRLLGDEHWQPGRADQVAPLIAGA
jgi:predicted dinucleotide-binding enzyme